MKAHFLLCAERAARTTDGLFVLHGILERLFCKQAPTSEAPFYLPSMSVAFEIRDAELTKQRAVRVRLTHAESGTVLFDQGFGVEPTRELSDKISGVLHFHHLALKALGTYRVTVDVDETQIAESDFLLLIAPLFPHAK